MLFSDDFSDGDGQWTESGPGGAARGTWAVTGGEYRQTSDEEDARSIAGSPGWSNYTVELDARKLGGAEGFLIMFGARDSGNFYWWNLGGFGNTQSVIEKATGNTKTTIASSTDTVTTGQTYHIKLQVEGRRIIAWLDGRKVHDFVDNTGVVEPLYQVMTRDEDTGEVVLKVVARRLRTFPPRARSQTGSAMQEIAPTTSSASTRRSAKGIWGHLPTLHSWSNTPTTQPSSRSRSPARRGHTARRSTSNWSPRKESGK